MGYQRNRTGGNVESIKSKVMIPQKKYSMVATVFIAVAALLFYGCMNPYKHLGNRPPLTPKDSAALLARCQTVIPLDTTSTYKESPIIGGILDSLSFYEKRADSLLKLKPTIKDSIIIKYEDSCKDAVPIWEEGFNLGYDVGQDKGKAAMAEFYKRALRQSDSLCYAQSVKLKQAYNLRLVAADNSVGIANKEATKYRNRSDNWKTATIWTGALAALFLILCIILWKFRRQAKAANSIINSSQDIVANVKKLT